MRDDIENIAFAIERPFITKFTHESYDTNPHAYMYAMYIFVLYLYYKYMKITMNGRQYSRLGNWRGIVKLFEIVHTFCCPHKTF